MAGAHKKTVSKSIAKSRFYAGAHKKTVSKSIAKSRFYAVTVGRKPGIYTDWAQASAQVRGYSNGRLKGFKTRDEAVVFLQSASSDCASDASSVVSDVIDVFTDGACSNNGRSDAAAGYAVVFPEYSPFDVSGQLSGPVQTNNRAEYTAVLEALRQTSDEIDPYNEKKLRVHTDSRLLIDSMTKYLPTWKRRNWKKSGGGQVLNRDLLEQIDALIESRVGGVEFVHVRAHTGGADWESRWNSVADSRAQAASRL